MRVLYLTNIEVPYRVRFFNELAKHCDLTVLYERHRSANRDSAWAGSEERAFKAEFLRGISLGNENAFSLGIFKWILGGYDAIVVGCFNSPVQLLAMLTMRLFRRPFFINSDGEAFLSGSGVKAKLKRFLLSGAKGYFAAGEQSARTMSDALKREVTPYYFSSLSDSEVAEHAHITGSREDALLVVGQYFDYKGMDVALEAAKMDPSVRYRFVGMGKRTEQFLQERMPKPLPNVEVIPFLQKQELERAYQTCAAVVLPSRQECWGLVINEAASFGTPIISTWGSGAAVEFLGEGYPQLLAQPGDPEDLYGKIRTFRAMDGEERAAYSRYLREKSKAYSIEKGVAAHMSGFQTQK